MYVRGVGVGRHHRFPSVTPDVFFLIVPEPDLRANIMNRTPDPLAGAARNSGKDPRGAAVGGVAPGASGGAPPRAGSPVQAAAAAVAIDENDLKTWLASVHPSLVRYAPFFLDEGYDDAKLVKAMDADGRDALLAALDAGKINPPGKIKRPHRKELVIALDLLVGVGGGVGAVRLRLWEGGRGAGRGGRGQLRRGLPRLPQRHAAGRPGLRPRSDVGAVRRRRRRRRVMTTPLPALWRATATTTPCDVELCVMCDGRAHEHEHHWTHI